MIDCSALWQQLLENPVLSTLVGALILFLCAQLWKLRTERLRKAKFETLTFDGHEFIWSGRGPIHELEKGEGKQLKDFHVDFSKRLCAAINEAHPDKRCRFTEQIGRRICVLDRSRTDRGALSPRWQPRRER